MSLDISAGIRMALALARDNLYVRKHEKRIGVAADHAGLVAAIAENSFIVLPGYVSEQQCAQLRSDIDGLMKRYPDCVQPDPFDSDHRIFGAEHGSAAIRAFHDDRFLRAIGESYCGRPLVNFATLAGRLEAKPGNLGSGQGWHRDAMARQFKSIVYLSDVGPDNGPFQIIPGSHQAGRKVIDVALGGLDPASTRISEAQIEILLRSTGGRIETILGAAGSLILVDTSAIHRGMPISSGTRHALTNYFYFPTQIDGGRFKKFLPMLTPERSARAAA